MANVNLSIDLAVECDISMSDEFQRALQDARRHSDFNDAVKTEVIKYLPPFGLALNVIFLFVVARVRSMHTIVNIYLANLALADGTFLTVALMGLRDGGLAYLATLQSLGNVTTFASYFFVTALAFERFYAICHPLTFRAAASKTRAAKIVGALWISAIVGGVGSYFVASQGIYVGALVATGIITCAFKVFGLLINVSLYACVVKTLQRQSFLSPAPTAHRQRLGRVVFMLIVNTAVFFSLNIIHIIMIIFALVLSVPSISCASLSAIRSQGSFLDALLTSEIMTVVNASINPLVYNGLNAEYRGALVEAFSFLCPTCCTSQCRGSSQMPVARIELQAR